MKTFIFGLVFLAVLGTGFADGSSEDDSTDDEDPCRPTNICSDADLITFEDGARCYFVTYSTAKPTHYELFQDNCDRKMFDCNSEEDVPTITRVDDFADHVEECARLRDWSRDESTGSS